MTAINMELDNISDMDLALFLEDRIPECDSVDIISVINDMDSLWLLGEMTLS